MIANFHTHTQLCLHAEGMPADYAHCAQKDGCSALGFSDHCPYPVSVGRDWDNCRMSVNDVKKYQAAVRHVAELSEFPVYTGFECEWDSAFESWYKDELKGKFEADYLVLGSHWVIKGSHRIYIANVHDKKTLHEYVDQTICGMKSGLFSFLAHPDIFMTGWREWDSEAEACSRAIIDAAVSLDMPIEVNGFGMIKPLMQTKQGIRFQYPFDEFWSMAAQSAVRVICNSDAHTPDVVLKNAQKARLYASNFMITPIDTLLSNPPRYQPATEGHDTAQSLMTEQGN